MIGRIDFRELAFQECFKGRVRRLRIKLDEHGESRKMYDSADLARLGADPVSRFESLLRHPWPLISTTAV